jgi:hypothetical protein
MAEVGAAIARAKAAGKVLAVKLVGNEPGQAWDSSEVRVGACECPLAGVACVSGDVHVKRVSLQITTRMHHHQSVASASTTGCSCGVCCAWQTLLEQTLTHTRNLEECATERASGRMLNSSLFFSVSFAFFSSRCQLDKRHVMLITAQAHAATTKHARNAAFPLIHTDAHSCVFRGRR